MKKIAILYHGLEVWGCPTLINVEGEVNMQNDETKLM
jgi:hypothetical protein